MIEVSIVVPVYKVEELLLRKCIQSCMNQNNKNIEILLVDDCSPDACGKICDEYAKKDKRVKVLHHMENKGLSAARNTGVKAAQGTWITFVDGDDWIEKETCDLPKIIHNNNIQIIFFGMFRDYFNKSEKLDFCYPDKKQFIGRECKELQRDVLDYYKRLSTAYCKFVKRNLIYDNSIFHNEDLKYGVEGIEYNFRLFGYANNVICYNKPLYHYVYNPNSITGSPNENTNFYILKGLHQIREDINSSGDALFFADQFTERILRVIVDISLGCYFNPNFNIAYGMRISKFNLFIEDDEIQNALHENGVSIKSKISQVTLFCIKNKLYWLLMIFGFLRLRILQNK